MLRYTLGLSSVVFIRRVIPASEAASPEGKVLGGTGYSVLRSLAVLVVAFHASLLLLIRPVLTLTPGGA